MFKKTMKTIINGHGPCGLLSGHQNKRILFYFLYNNFMIFSFVLNCHLKECIFFSQEKTLEKEIKKHINNSRYAFNAFKIKLFKIILKDLNCLRSIKLSLSLLAKC